VIFFPLSALGLFLWAAFLVLFRKGKRRLGGGLMVVAFAAFIFGLKMFSNSEAVSRGFADFSDQMAAEKAGFTDAPTWIAHNNKLVADQQAATEATAAAIAAEQKTQAELAAAKVAADAAKAEEARRADLAEQADVQRYGHSCLSLWDGSHEGFIRAVKGQLNDPESFEHDDTSTWPMTSEGRNTILMHFRARNGFGGIIRGRASGSFDNQSCDKVIVDFIE
jgi:hypothetical protein